MKIDDAIYLLRLFFQGDFESGDDNFCQRHGYALYAKRKASLGGKDHFFVVNLYQNPCKPADLNMILQEARKYVNSQYKVPKAFRMKIPNIVVIFVKEGAFSEEVIAWSKENTRTMVGGEIFAACLIDTESMMSYGQGINYVRVSPTSISMRFAFKEIDPQNRTFKWMKRIMDHLENTPLPSVQPSYAAQNNWSTSKFNIHCPYCYGIVAEDTVYCPHCHQDTTKDAKIENHK